MFIYLIIDVLSMSVVRVLGFQNDALCLRFLSQVMRMPNSPFMVNVSDTIMVRCAKVNDSDDFSVETFNDSTFNVSSISTNENGDSVFIPLGGDVKDKVFRGIKIVEYERLVKEILKNDNVIKFEKGKEKD